MWSEARYNTNDQDDSNDEIEDPEWILDEDDCPLDEGEEV